MKLNKFDSSSLVPTPFSLQSLLSYYPFHQRPYGGRFPHTMTTELWILEENFPKNADRLNQLAALVVKHGLPHECLLYFLSPISWITYALVLWLFCAIENTQQVKLSHVHRVPAQTEGIPDTHWAQPRLAGVQHAKKWVWGWGGAGNKSMGSFSDICTAQLDSWQRDPQLYSAHAPRTWNLPVPAPPDIALYDVGLDGKWLSWKYSKTLSSLLADSFPSRRDVSPLSTKKASQQLVDI